MFTQVDMDDFRKNNLQVSNLDYWQIFRFLWQTNMGKINPIGILIADLMQI